jgi:hypothetical protein
MNAPGNEPSSLSEVERLQTTLDVTNTLIAASSSTDPLRALTASISKICHGTSIIYDFEGAIVASTGAAPSQLIWNEASTTNRRDLSFEVGRWHVRTRRVSLRDGVHVIAIASQGGERLQQIGELLFDTAERLLGAVHGIRYGAVQRDRRDNEQLIAALHDGALPSREHRFWNRLEQFRFQPYSPIRALELAPIDGDTAHTSHLAQVIDRARTDELPLLATLRRTEADAPETIAAIVPSTAAAEAWITQISGKFLVGCSGASSTLSQVPQLVRESETSLGIARQWLISAESPNGHGAVFMDRIDLSTWLLSHVDARQRNERVKRTLDAIPSAQLRETLVTYLASDLNIARTAEAQFLHPNTVRYRLSRIEDSLAGPLTSPFNLANFILALHPAIVGRRAELAETDTTAP